jgi:hypothetical protein
MKNPKFRPNLPAYLVVLHDTTGFHAKATMKLIEVHVKKSGTRYVEGFYFERYSNVVNFPGLANAIITKKKKKKGVEIPFEPHDTVAIGRQFRVEDLCTFDEAKLKMIEYIANNFGDTMICDGSCGG